MYQQKCIFKIKLHVTYGYQWLQHNQQVNTLVWVLVFTIRCLESILPVEWKVLQNCINITKNRLIMSKQGYINIHNISPKRNENLFMFSGVILILEPTYKLRSSLLASVNIALIINISVQKCQREENWNIRLDEIKLPSVPIW